MYFTSGTTGNPKMVAHDFTYPLGHIVTGSFWHNLHKDSLHLTIADTGWGKAVWGKLYGQWIAGATVFVYDHEKFTPADMLQMITGLPHHIFVRTSYHFPFPDTRRPDKIRPVVPPILYHCRRSLKPCRIRHVLQTDRHQADGRFRTDGNNLDRRHFPVDGTETRIDGCP